MFWPNWVKTNRNKDRNSRACSKISFPQCDLRTGLLTKMPTTLIVTRLLRRNCSNSRQLQTIPTPANYKFSRNIQRCTQETTQRKNTTIRKGISHKTEQEEQGTRHHNRDKQKAKPKTSKHTTSLSLKSCYESNLCLNRWMFKTTRATIFCKGCEEKHNKQISL